MSEVAELPRRVAHAVHALLVASKQHGMPATAAEILVYDEESLSVHETAGALVAARTRGYVTGVPPYWVPLNRAYEAERRLEDRFLSDTASRASRGADA